MNSYFLMNKLNSLIESNFMMRIKRSRNFSKVQVNLEMKTNLTKPSGKTWSCKQSLKTTSSTCSLTRTKRKMINQDNQQEKIDLVIVLDLHQHQVQLRYHLVRNCLLKKRKSNQHMCMFSSSRVQEFTIKKACNMWLLMPIGKWWNSNINSISIISTIF